MCISILQAQFQREKKKCKPYYVALFAMSMDVYISLVRQYILTGGKQAIGEVAIDIWCGCKL